MMRTVILLLICMAFIHANHAQVGGTNQSTDLARIFNIPTSKIRSEIGLVQPGVDSVLVAISMADENVSLRQLASIVNTCVAFL